jgi:hypothetical protein
LAGNWDVGFDSGTSLYTLIRLYEYWLKVNDKIVVHWRPVVGDDNPLPDLSVYGITGAIETAGATSAEDTDYLLRSAYNEAVTP